MADELNVVVRAVIDPAQVQAEINKKLKQIKPSLRIETKYPDLQVAIKQIRSLEKDIGRTDNAFEALSNTTKDIISHFSVWGSQTKRVISSCRALDDVISDVTELDTSMTLLREATGATDDQFSHFLENAVSKSAELHTSIVQLISASSGVQSLDSSLAELGALGETAAVYSNLGSSIDQISQSVQNMIRIFTLFNSESNHAVSTAGEFGQASGSLTSSSSVMSESLHTFANALKNKLTEVFSFKETAQGQGEAMNTQVSAPVQESGTSMERYLSTVESGKETLDGYDASLQAVSASSQLAAIGMSALSAVGNALMSTGISIAIDLIVKGIDSLIHYQDNLAKKAQELVQYFQNLKNEISSLDGEFGSISSRIDELNGKEGLSKTEEGELKRLKEQKELLQDELALKTELAKFTGIDAEEAMTKKYQSNTEASIQNASLNYDEMVPFATPMPVNVTVPEAIKERIEEVKQLRQAEKELIAQRGQYEDNSNDWKKLNKEIETNNAQQQTNIQYITEHASALYDDAQQIDGTTEKGRELKDTAEALVSEFIEMQSADFSETFDSIVAGNEKFAGMKEELINLAAQGELTADTLNSDKYAQLAEALEAAGYTTDEIVQYFEHLSEAAGSASNSVSGIDTSMQALQNAKLATQSLVSSINSMSTAFQEQAENGSLSAESILKIIDAGYAAALVIDQETGAVTLNKDAYIQLAQAKIQEQIISLQAKKDAIIQAALDEAKAAKEAAGGHLTNAEAILIEKKALANNSEIKAIDAQLAVIKNFNFSKVTAGLYGVSSAASSAANSIKQALTQAKSNIESLISMVVDVVRQGYQDEIDSLNSAKDAVQKRYEVERKAAENAWKEKQDYYDQEKDALKDQLDAYQRIIDAKKDSLKADKESADYQKQLTERQREIAELQNSILEISNDDSVEGIKRRLELEEELAEKQSGLEDFQSDRAYDVAVDALDQELERFEEETQGKLNNIEIQEEAEQLAHERYMERLEERNNAEMESYQTRIQALQDYLSQSGQLRQEAMALITANIQNTDLETNALYQALIERNRLYGSGIDADVTTAWWNAYSAMQTYGWDTSSVINDLTIEISKLGSAVEALSGRIQSTTGDAQKLINLINRMPEPPKYHGGENNELPLPGSQTEAIFEAFRMAGYWHSGTSNVSSPSSASSFDRLYKDIKEDEVFAKLQKGEAVISKKDKPKWVNAYRSIRDEATDQRDLAARLMGHISSLPDISSQIVSQLPVLSASFAAGTAGSPQFNMQFNVEGSLDKAAVPAIKQVINDAFNSIEHQDKFAKYTVDKLVKNSANRGIVRNQRFNLI